MTRRRAPKRKLEPDALLRIFWLLFECGRDYFWSLDDIGGYEGLDGYPRNIGKCDARSRRVAKKYWPMLREQFLAQWRPEGPASHGFRQRPWAVEALDLKVPRSKWTGYF
jgi:hypothetical protein